MTNKEVNDLIQRVLDQVNAAFDQDRKRLDALEKELEKLKSPGPGRPKKAA